MSTTCVRRFGRWVSLVSKRGFSSSCSSSSSCIQSGGAEQGVKSLNLYSAINQALHVALDTDPRWVSSSLLTFMYIFCLIQYICRYTPKKKKEKRSDYPSTYLLLSVIIVSNCFELFSYDLVLKGL